MIEVYEKFASKLTNSQLVHAAEKFTGSPVDPGDVESAVVKHAERCGGLGEFVEIANDILLPSGCACGDRHD